VVSIGESSVSKDAVLAEAISAAVASEVAAGCVLAGAAGAQPVSIDSINAIKKNMEMFFCFIANSFVFLLGVLSQTILK
jgi:hypothetical protein